MTVEAPESTETDESTITHVDTPEAGADISHGDAQAEADPPGDGDRKMPREQRYRLERNEARQALAEAQARIDSLLSREVERIASKSLSNPADIFTLSGKAVADVLDDNGDVNPELVEQLATEILGSRPGLRPNAPMYDPTQGMSGNHRGVPVGWEALGKF